jgi:hypothetical protein
MSNFHYCKDNTPNNLNLFAKNIECDDIAISGYSVVPTASPVALGLTNFVGLNSQGLGSKLVKRYGTDNFGFAKYKIREYSVQFECEVSAGVSTISCDFQLDNLNENLIWKYNHIDLEASNNEYQGYTFTKVGDKVTLTVNTNTTFPLSDARWSIQLKTAELL